MVDDFINEMIAKIQRRKDFGEMITCSTDYIDWLERFTESQAAFSTDSMQNELGNLSDEDRQNVEDVEFLFEVIAEYSKANYLYPVKDDCESYFTIQHNGVGYRIGMDTDFGQGSSFYCIRLEKPVEGSLEFRHVMSSEKLPKTVFVERQLDELATLIEKLSDQDVPLTAIQEMTETTIGKIKIKREEKKEKN